MAATVDLKRGDQVGWPSAPPDLGGRLIGAVLDVRDRGEARAFYGELLGETPGKWGENEGELVFRSGSQRLHLVERRRPRTLGSVGAHIALAVPASAREELAHSLRTRGAEVSWWREDHPSEYEPSPYVTDPSGNRIQLVAATGDLLIPHAMLLVHDGELADKFYTRALGGIVEHYHGWGTDDIVGASRWAAGDDPCAPWTRAMRYSRLRHENVARPIPSLFFRFEDTVLGTTVAIKFVQQPPEHQLKGSPRLIFRVRQSAGEQGSHLSGIDVSTLVVVVKPQTVRFRREGDTLFVRDRSGNFLQIECSG